MSGTIKKYLNIGILLIILIMVLAQVAPDLYTETTAVSDNASLPTMVRTMFTFAGWVPIVLLMVAVITMNFGGKIRRAIRRRRRR